jgi:arabinogalactan endo-1,4-beta-galactosidase
VARVTSLENTNAWAKSGVMMRESLNANSEHALMALTASNGVAFQRRTSTGGSSAHTSGGSASAPIWVRLVRSGNTITAYTSGNGSNWTQVGSATINMANNIYVGLAVTAHNDSTLATSQLDNVTVSSGSPQPTDTSVPTDTPIPTATPTLPPTPTPIPGNLVVNGGFETGSLTPWTVWNSATVTSSGQRSGSFAGQITSSAGSLEQVVTGLTPNTTYELRGWARVTSGNSTVYVGVKEFGSTETNSPTTSTSYVERIVQFTTGSANTSAKIYLWKSGGSGSAYGDDFTMTVIGGPTPAPTSPPGSFAKGADVSHLLQLEDFGGTFFDDGVQKDLLQILKDHGVDSIRIKVWNDPGNPCCFPADQSDPAGYNNPAHVTQLAVRAHNMGFRIMIDFHYSDWWADPGKQYMPHEWEGQSITQLQSSLYNFTFDTLMTLKNNGVTPEWVQVGNEITGGMMWPVASTDNWDNLAALLKEGYNATKAVDPSIQVILHYDNGGNNSGAVWWYDSAQSRGVQWDIIGLSFYPNWHGSLGSVDFNMDNLSARYGKDVMIVETAYPWTSQNGDAEPNAYTDTGPVSYPMSPTGQRQFLDDLVNRIKAVPNGRGKGFFYWEPEFIPVEGAGWQYGAGDGWDNATLFDFNGNALSSLDAYLDY